MADKNTGTIDEKVIEFYASVSAELLPTIKQKKETAKQD
jgi:hypothetical protein